MGWRHRALLAGAIVALSAGAAMATPQTLTGNYLQVGISDSGTFGSDGNTSPGILHDPTGSQNFGNNDYLTPGSPHDGFFIASSEFSGINDNYNSAGDFGSASPTLLTGAAAGGYSHAATWTGGNSQVGVTNSYFFNDNDQRIIIKTQITALTDLTNLAFARSVDPDPDVNTFGSFSTENQRGNSSFGVNDFVGAAGPQTGLTLALVNLDTNGFAHTTQINGSCCNNINPYDVLAHTGGDKGESASGDYGLNLAYLVGDLAQGNSVTLTYAYAVGDNIQVVGTPVSAAPEPSTWLLMIGGVGVLGAALRRRVSVLHAA